MPRRPNPAPVVGSKPTPSSRTVRVTSAEPYTTETFTERAAACLRTLASASWVVLISTTSLLGGSLRDSPSTVWDTVTPSSSDSRVRQPPQRVVEGGSVERRRAERRDQRAGLGQVLPGRLYGQTQMPRRIAPRLGGLDEHDDAGEPLGDGVVDLPGQPLPLGQRALLGRQPGDLGLAGLQLPDQVGALGALADDPGDPRPEHQRERDRDRGGAAEQHQVGDAQVGLAGGTTAPGRRLSTTTATTARRPLSSMNTCGQSANSPNDAFGTISVAGMNAAQSMIT